MGEVVFDHNAMAMQAVLDGVGVAIAQPLYVTDALKAGRLVAPDAGSLAAALGDLLRSPELRARMGRAGRKRAETCFSLDRQVAAMVAIYREACLSA